MKVTNKSIITKAEKSAKSLKELISLLPVQIVNNCYFKTRFEKTSNKVNYKAVFNKTERADEPMTVVFYRYPKLILRYKKNIIKAAYIQKVRSGLVNCIPLSEHSPTSSRFATSAPVRSFCSFAASYTKNYITSSRV